MRKLIPVLLLIGFVAAPWCAFVQAQDKEEESPGLAQVWTFKVSPQHFLQFESALKSHIAWQEQNEARYSWNVFQVIVGKEYGTYIIRSQNLTWEDLDANAPFFARQVEHFRRYVTPLLESIESSLTEVDWKHSKWPEDLPDPMLYEVYYYYLDPMHVGGFVEALGEITKAMVDREWPVNFGWLWVRNGGYMPTAILVVPHSNWAHFKDPEKSFMEVLTEAYGEEKAKELVVQFRQAVRKINNIVVVRRPDLAYVANE